MKGGKKCLFYGSLRNEHFKLTRIKILTTGATTTAPSNLKTGELAYSYLNDSGSAADGFGAGGDRLFIGAGGDSTVGGVLQAERIDVIGGKYFTDLLNHPHGTLTASSAITVTSTYTNFPSSGFGIGGIKLMDGGTKLVFKNYSSGGDYYLVNLTNADDITAGTYGGTTGDMESSGYDTYSYGFGAKSDGTKFYSVLSTVNDYTVSYIDLVEISVGTPPE